MSQMHMTKITFSNMTEITTQLWVVPVAKTHIDEALTRIAVRTGTSIKLISRDFEAGKNEQWLSYPLQGPADMMLLLGLGEGKPEQLRQGIRSVIHKYRSRILGPVSIDLTAFYTEEGTDLSPYVQAAAEGAYLGMYELGLYKTESGSPERKKTKLDWIQIVAPDTDDSYAAFVKGQQIAAAQCRALDIVNRAPNYKYAETLAEIAESSGREHGYKVRIYRLQELQEMAFGGLLGVNQGSHNPPVFIEMEYEPANKPEAPLKKVAFVGKGVTFDTGGISIKGAENMMWMKSDLGGAAAVIGAMEAAARLQLPVRLVGAVPATDNMPDGKAMVPGDVLTTYSGITVEVENTDAEGRLILADALSWVVQQHSPDAVIDLATLTGACIMALGYQAAGLFTPNDELAQALAAAGDSCGERVWRLPLWDEYADSLKSDVADLKNMGGRGAGAVTAAKFLEKFTAKHPAWAHLDIAGVALADSEYGSMRHATGYGVRLLVNYLEALGGK